LRTDGHLSYLGYVVTRGGLRLGPKARERMRQRLPARAGDSRALRASVAAYAAGRMFGSVRAARRVIGDRR
jgi:hypothetical protein